MRLSDWAADPHASGPPPIPLMTDVVNSTNVGYRVGAIPPSALADDLAAAGLTYSPGRGHGYRRHGEPIDSYLVGDVIADVFQDSADCLGYYLDTDPIMSAIRDDEAALARLPYRDRTDDFHSTRRDLRRRIADAEAPLSISYAQLALVRDSFAATGRSVRGIPFVRTEALRRFRSVIPAPVRVTTASPVEVLAFLESFPGGALLPRPALHEAATKSGLSVGARTLYEAADAAGWTLTRRKGLHHYRAPDAP